MTEKVVLLLFYTSIALTTCSVSCLHYVCGMQSKLDQSFRLAQQEENQHSRIIEKISMRMKIQCCNAILSGIKQSRGLKCLAVNLNLL
jgi:hypothetical protein